MAAPPIDIRVMTKADLGLAVGWAAAEGWNPGLCDADCFHSADPGGFLMAFEGGEPVAAISVVAYDEAFGFLGFYMVRPDRRGRGIGLRLWEEGMRRLGTRTVGLDGVVAQQANYLHSGFVLAHRNIRYSGVPSVGDAVNEAVRGVTEADLPDIATFDRRHFPAAREGFLSGWLTAPGHRVFLAERDGRMVGYGVARPCREGWKIGPLFARDPGIADGVFDALLRSCGEGAAVTLDVPEPNVAASGMARRRGLSPAFETARMYRGPVPDLPLDAIFAITSFELG